MHSDSDNIPDAMWEQTYLDADQVDHANVNNLAAHNFLLDDEDRKHQTASA